MIRISKKEASEQLQMLKESYGVDPIYIDEKAAKAFECLELYINDKEPLEETEIEHIISVLNSATDRWIYDSTCRLAKDYENLGKLKKKKALENIELERITFNFLSFMQTHGIYAFIDYIQCNDFFEEV